MLLSIGLIGSLTANLSAQNKVWVENNPLQKANAANKVLQSYIDVSLLPMNKRPKAFSDVSAVDKANIFRLHLALQFVKRQNLTKDQTDIILESISAISPDTYDRTKDRKNTEMSAQSLQARAASIFSQQETSEIFASLGGNKEDIETLTNYQNINAFPSRTEKQDAFGKLSPINKSNFWKVQMLLSIATNSNLNVEQQNLILETITSINPELYTKDDSKLKIKRERLLPLKEKIMKAFPEEVGVPIFSMMGDGEIVPDEGVVAGCHCLKDS